MFSLTTKQLMMLYIFCLKDSISSKHNTHKGKKNLAISEIGAIWSQFCAICSRVTLSWVGRSDQMTHCVPSNPNHPMNLLRGLRLLNFPTHYEFLSSCLFLNIENVFLCLALPSVSRSEWAGDGAPAAQPALVQRWLHFRGGRCSQRTIERAGSCSIFPDFPVSDDTGLVMTDWARFRGEKKEGSLLPLGNPQEIYAWEPTLFPKKTHLWHKFAVLSKK